MHPALVVAWLNAAALAAPGPDARLKATVDHEAHVRDVEAFRKRRDDKLRSDAGWLTMAALAWLGEGENTFGSGPGNAVVLPAPLPAVAGRFVRHGKSVRIEVAPGVAITHDGRPVTSQELRADAPGVEPDVLVFGPLRIYVIDRGERVGVRVRDLESPRRKAFTGLTWYPIDPAMRVVGRFVPHDKPVTITVPTVVDTTQAYLNPGRIHFTLGGRALSLLPLIEDAAGKEYFVIFRDLTSGSETYGGGRFMYVPLPGPDGTVVVDFNKAYAPPCSLSPFSTCPLPPKENRLPVRIAAGERNGPATRH